MRLLWSEQLRTHLKNPFYFLILSGTFFVVVFSFVSVSLMVSRLSAGVDDYMEHHNVGDFYVTMGQIEVEHLTGAQHYDLCIDLYTGDIPSLFKCLDDYDPRDPDREKTNALNRMLQASLLEKPDVAEAFYATMIDPIRALDDFEFEMSLDMLIADNGYYYRFLSINEHINQPYVSAGRLPSATHEIGIFESFAVKNNLALGDPLIIGDKTFEITGFLFQVNFMLPSVRQAFSAYDPQRETLVWANDEIIYDFAAPYRVHYHGMGDLQSLQAKFDVSDIYNVDLRFFGRNMQMIQQIIPSEYNFHIQAIQHETELTAVFASAFFAIFVVLSSVLTLIIFGRLMERQKRNLHILTSLGFSNHKLTLSMMTLSFMVSLVVLVAFTAGVLLSVGLFEHYSARYEMPKAEFFIPFSIVLWGLFAPLILINSASFIFVRLQLERFGKAVKTTRLRLKLKQFAHLAMTTILFLLSATLIVFSLSAYRMIAHFAAETMRGNHFEQMVFLRTFHNETIHEEPFTTARAQIIAIDGRRVDVIRVQTYGLKTSTTRKRLLDDNVESNRYLEDGVIITEQLAYTQDLVLGDVLTFFINNTEYVRPIVGIHNDLIERAVYFEQGELNGLLGFGDDYYNGYFTDDASLRDERAYRLINYKDNAAEIDALFRLTMRVVTLLMALALFLSAAIFAFVTIISLEQKRVAFMTLKALGASFSETYSLFFLTSFIALALAFLGAFFLSGAIVDAVVAWLAESFDYVFSRERPASAVLFGFAGVAIAVGAITLWVHALFEQGDMSRALKSE